MKRSSTPSTRPADRLVAAAPALRLAPVLALVLVLGLVTAGCVTKGSFDEVVAQRDVLAGEKRRLEARVEQMGASIESLGSERTKLIDDLETLRIKREELAAAVQRLERSESYLSTNLEAREQELAERKAELGKLRGTYQDLVQELEAEVASGQIAIEQLREGLRLNVAQDILFASGSTTLNRSGSDVLRRVAKQIKQLGHRVEIQGHTDNVPIRASAASRYPTNWELAAARAAVVVRLLATEGVDPTLLSAVSYGEFQPVASNDTPEGRLRNRRIEIRLEPAEKRPASPEAEPANDSAASSDASPAPGSDAPAGS